MENIINTLKQKLQDMGITEEKISEIRSKIDPRKFDMDNLDGAKLHIMEVLNDAKVESEKAAEAVKQAFSQTGIGDKMSEMTDKARDMFDVDKS